ncbi:MAG: hypothetical protein ACM36C_09320 [Acidobacteriota bacterium]
MRLQKVVGSEIHPCKCIVGIYETYDGKIVRIVDLVGDRGCHHRLGQQLQRVDDDNVRVPSGPALARRSP